MSAKRYLVMGVAGMTLAGCTLPWMNKPQTTGEVVNEMQELGAAMQAGEPMRCVMTDAEGVRVEYDVMGEKMRMAGIQMGEKTGYMINDGEYVYTWEEGGTEGMKIRIPTEEEIQETAEAAEEYAQDIPDFYSEGEMAEYEDMGYSIECNPTELNDDSFVPPAEVNFTDPTVMMQEAADEMDISELDPELQQQIKDAMEGLGQ